MPCHDSFRGIQYTRMYNPYLRQSKKLISQEGEEATMRIGIGHPATIPGAKGQLILDWAKKADAGPFSSLGSLDRLVYPNYDALITLTAAAAVTQRIRLMTNVHLCPLPQVDRLSK